LNNLNEKSVELLFKIYDIIPVFLIGEITMQPITYADMIRPRIITNRTVYNAILVLAASLLLALSAQIAIPLPFTPVPVTAQTFAVLFLAALLGRKRAVYAVALYLIQGASGLPVFAGGNAGIVYLTGMTGGYLIGFLPAAYLCGFLAERKWDRHYVTASILFASGSAVILLCGVFWLALYTSLEFALQAGLYPFVIADLIKIIIALVSLPSGWKIIERFKQ
jgi:biotin transport system substrate-specific component